MNVRLIPVRKEYHTPARTLSISGLKSQVLKLTFFNLRIMKKNGLFSLKQKLKTKQMQCTKHKNLNIVSFNQNILENLVITKSDDDVT